MGRTLWSFANRDGGDGEGLSLAILIQGEGRSYGRWRPFGRDDRVDSGGYRARLQSESIREERSGGSRIATEVMAKPILGDTDSRRGKIAKI
jgi:hypothetical protein